jgi:hypothetical protein
VAASEVEVNLQAVIPWLGGDYNPWEACDTHQSGSLVDGEYANEEIESSCHPLICPKGPPVDSYYRNHPTSNIDRYRCAYRDREVVTTTRNVKSSHKTNLCKQAPDVPRTCTSPHGMIASLQGRPVRSLYGHQVLRHRDKIVAQAWAGLFVHGGNPLYYTYKGTPEDVADEVQAVMRSSPEDLGGHHLVLKIARDDTFYTSSEDLPRGFTYHMWVEKAPLTAAGNNVLKSYTAADSIDPATRIFQSSLASTVPTSGILKGWLRNLASSMRLDEQLSRADKLHPAPPSAESPSSAATGAASPGKWSCPLRRISFWTQVTSNFSPIVPLPGRTARIFGNSARSMTHCTRAHPTQAFSSLYSVLADVSTSNGFCFCVDWRDCQVLSSSEQQSPCTLLSTVRSMYDRKFRTSTLLTSNDNVCTRQLDWPFVGGDMRDGSVSNPRYNNGAGIQLPTDPAKGTCNVLDRLPPFQYRYMPSGKVFVPITQGSRLTSLSEGGACHMGRAARLPPTPLRSSVQTATCRKIHSNHTHVVARCFSATQSGSGPGYTDLEMVREMSAAPDRMVRHMRTARSRCNPQECDAASAPAWKLEALSGNLPKGPEVSFGIPFRWSAARYVCVCVLFVFFLWINMRVISNCFFFRKHADTFFCAC